MFSQRKRLELKDEMGSNLLGSQDSTQFQQIKTKKRSAVALPDVQGRGQADIMRYLDRGEMGPRPAPPLGR